MKKKYSKSRRFVFKKSCPQKKQSRFLDMTNEDKKNSSNDEVLLFVVNALKMHERELDRIIQRLEAIKKALLVNSKNDNQKSP